MGVSPCRVWRGTRIMTKRFLMFPRKLLPLGVQEGWHLSVLMKSVAGAPFCWLLSAVDVTSRGSVFNDVGEEKECVVVVLVVCFARGFHCVPLGFV